MKELSEILGFYFLVYQRSLNENFIKCWIDGSEDYIYYTKKDLINFIRQDEDKSLPFIMMESFNDTGIFMWDVNGGYIKRLHSVSGKDKGIMEYVMDTADDLKKPLDEKILDNIIEIKKDKIKIFK